MAAMTDVGTVVETAMLVTGGGLVGIGSLTGLALIRSQPRKS